MTDGDGIRCPKCSRHMGVAETRGGPSEIRRRRRCPDKSCGITLWTVESASADLTLAPDLALVPRKLLRRLQKLVKELSSPSVARETSCASQDRDDSPVIE